VPAPSYVQGVRGDAQILVLVDAMQPQGPFANQRVRLELSAPGLRGFRRLTANSSATPAHDAFRSPPATEPRIELPCLRK
jgi:hypothetical protein